MAESHFDGRRRVRITGKGKTGADRPSPDVHVPKTTDGPADTGAGKAANDASKKKVSRSVTHDGASGPGQGEPVPESTDIPEPTPHPIAGPANEGNGPAPLGS